MLDRQFALCEPLLSLKHRHAPDGRWTLTIAIDQERLAKAFWDRTSRGADCWTWTGCVHSQTGYGSYSFRGKGYRAHRLSLMLHGVDVPDGLDVCHTCDNRRCVNPAHLYVGTRKQNMADCTTRHRHNKPRGEPHWRAKLTDSQVRAIRARRSGGETTVALGAAFSVNPATISRIARNVWRAEVT